MNKIWLNSVGVPFVARFKKSLTGISDHSMFLMKPDGTEAEKTNTTISGRELRWSSGIGDFDQEGKYSLQPWIDDGVLSARREPLVFEVLANQKTGEV